MPPRRITGPSPSPGGIPSLLMGYRCHIPPPRRLMITVKFVFILEATDISPRVGVWALQGGWHQCHPKDGCTDPHPAEDETHLHDRSACVSLSVTLQKWEA